MSSDVSSERSATDRLFHTVGPLTRKLLQKGLAHFLSEGRMSVTKSGLAIVFIVFTSSCLGVLTCIKLYIFLCCRRIRFVDRLFGVAQALKCRAFNNFTAIYHLLLERWQKCTQLFSTHSEHRLAEEHRRPSTVADQAVVRYAAQWRIIQFKLEDDTVKYFLPIATILSPSATPPGCQYSVTIFVLLRISNHFFGFADYFSALSILYAVFLFGVL